MKISYTLPDKTIDNTVFHSLGWTEEQVYLKTGIRSRRVCEKNEFALDLAERACRSLFCDYAVDPASVGYLLYCTQSPDSVIPTNACVLQNRLGLSDTVGALDFNLGCSGFVYGLSLAKGLLLSGQTTAVLLVTAETYSKYIHPSDRANLAIFGDGAAATLLTTDDAHRLGGFIFGTDGSAAGSLEVGYSGLRGAQRARRDASGDSIDNESSPHSDHHLRMHGPEIFNLTMHHIPRAITSLLEKNDLSMDDIDHFVFHQANAYMLDCLREKMGAPKDRFHINLENTGNTVSSTIPILLKTLLSQNTIRKNQKVMLAGFGVGYSWAATILKT